ncbi:lipoyl synthase [candidate division KSB1 bacterium]
MGIRKIEKLNLKTGKNEQRLKRPDWLKVTLRATDEFREVKDLVKDNGLHTICESAHCPNIGECWGEKTATFMILGDICTRSCGFCAVKTGKPDDGLDMAEAERVAEAVKKLGLVHAVITSVNRDERKDGGSPLFAETIRAIKRLSPECRVEVLIPDFRGERSAIDTVLEAGPDILNHNLETVKRLYLTVRPQAKYERSLELLGYSKEKGAVTKSGIMVGIGESNEEIFKLMNDLRGVDCDILTIGQYLQPTRKHLPVERFVTPEEFDEFRERGLEMGFKFVESGPLVRSSYHAAKQVV